MQPTCEEAPYLPPHAHTHSAAQASVASPLGDALSGKQARGPAHKEVLVVVSNLEELEDHWQVR